MIRRARGVIIEPFIRAEEEAKIVLESRVHVALYAVILLGLCCFEFMGGDELLAFADAFDQTCASVAKYN